ncbi:spermine/spermidine synthase [Virgibacillus sp. NKC19-3]|uniref:spermine/spermidine synthase domain-containing protein n=1 Tax=Virgibacillus saliphilus TaxID=2831674 RepID=UPI001C9A86CF|nr:spermine/spermidine synthase [Virgibacillus sp. NKC19-3]MBY7143548.1 spermine/spermidine synthase [Virgibacillus sp. NKC19-3]
MEKLAEPINQNGHEFVYYNALYQYLLKDVYVYVWSNTKYNTACSYPRGEIQLQQRGNHYEIISNGTFLMATYNGESERLLVSAALKNTVAPRKVLVGGLGVGFSLAEALCHEQVTEVTVIEIEKAIITWNRTYLAAFSNHALEDSRTTIIQADFLEWINAASDKFDVICLDIDNGPDWTVTDSNTKLYQTNTLHLLAGLLSSGGVLAFWSAASSQAFVEKLKKYFEEVQEIPVPQEKGEDDYIYLAKVPFHLYAN